LNRLLPLLPESILHRQRCKGLCGGYVAFVADVAYKFYQYFFLFIEN